MKEQTKERVSLHILKRERGHDLVHDRVTNPAPAKHHINTITLCPLRVVSPGRSEPPHSPLLSAWSLVQKAHVSLVLPKATPKSSSNSSSEAARIHL